MTTSLPLLNKRFNAEEHYLAPAGQPYSLLPFRFIPLDSNRYVLTNFAGQYHLATPDDLRRFIRHELPVHSGTYNALKAKHFLLDAESTVALDLLAIQYRTRQAFLAQFTSLFMFVTTLRCEHTCTYCQVSRQSEDKVAYDMTPEIADHAVDFMFHSPSPSIKVEFQGGESLLNFDTLKHIVYRVEARNQTEGRNVAFVIATNLACLTDEHLAFCREHNIYISTSLDGPRELHNKNRPRPGRDSYQLTIDAIRRVRESLGDDKVSALMTTTEASLEQPKAIIDEYVAQGFNSIFLRSISPYGFARRSGMVDRYRISDWIAFFKESLAYIIDLNYKGVPFREEFSSIILRKILTPFATGYVDLQSPAGIGISGLVFNYDGDVYASDESRMLSEMGDKHFRLGNVVRDSYRDVMLSDTLVNTLADSMTEGVPMCADCGLQPYCGSDPVRHYAVHNDIVGFKPTSDHCRKHMAVIKHLITLLEDDERAAAVLRTWA